jgi:L-lysine exporter family protein LysE/ArgO
MFLYGTRVWVKALLLRSAKFTPSSGRSVRQTIVETLAINLFNPIALIQVIVLVGGISATYSGSARFAFLSAALAVVVLWFFGLAFGAAWLSPILARPMVQRGLDGMIGVLMYALAWSLISGQFD